MRWWSRTIWSTSKAMWNHSSLWKHHTFLNWKMALNPLSQILMETSSMISFSITMIQRQSHRMEDWVLLYMIKIATLIRLIASMIRWLIQTVVVKLARYKNQSLLPLILSQWLTLTVTVYQICSWPSKKKTIQEKSTTKSYWERKFHKLMIHKELSIVSALFNTKISQVLKTTRCMNLLM